MPWGTGGGADRLGKAVTAQAAMHIHVQVGTLVHMQQCMGSAQSKHKLTLGLDKTEGCCQGVLHCVRFI